MKEENEETSKEIDTHQKNWDEVYAKQNMTLWEPQQSIVQFTARFVKKRIGYDKYEVKRNANKILDLGCGNGGAVHFFAKQGFEAHGIDISKAAIFVAEDYLKKESLTAKFEICSCDNLPFENNTFDVITCFGVLDHVDMNLAIGTIKEVKRTLTNGGLFFITLCSTRATPFGRGEKTERHTYVLEEGHEKGEIQHYFDLEEIRELLDGFKIIDLRHSTEEAYGQNNEPLGKSARWFVTAEATE
ncbi:class I SAM-dependent methyltransferase [Candidatus Woesearchaeota archaeon]|jgi:2-polyprenyl-3-methyl-5-hydroxy-6-metoxy-1,4-benzoquinol methylase|nr:class I SAM-dependent methyltransferase [Candidatus Woesearchaeota archaeon]MBT3538443.1 class I SAM-dependent methyltransferase [Candidatus Woesearchaeota archaeon]MBT4697006.1 class I SAM-dependent methyltransferase [Candidatus Woesearchaeota archaeon]MBT7106101.1 class I SAM-dependent methyltransferase [Candidatus Woesearchaeota archaeon]MBT7931001.1 class I SAM-dependent methyltransferase [Candidatus Woesearchaeota archaeon]